MRGHLRLAGLLLFAWCACLHAEIVVGINLSASGSDAHQGEPAKQAVLLWPRTLGDEIAHYILLDDASDPTIAGQNIERLLNEQQVDVIVGPTSPHAQSVATPLAQRAEIPMLSLSATAPARLPWIYPVVPARSLATNAIARHMQHSGANRVAFLGLANPYGNDWYEHLQQSAQDAGLTIVVDERYRLGETSLSGHALRVLEFAPDAVFVGDTGAAAALAVKALRERGFVGAIYATSDAAVPEFLQAVDPTVIEGVHLPVVPAIIARDLPAQHPARDVAQDFVERYEARYGTGSVMPAASDAWSAWVWLNSAVRRAKNAGAQPGSPEFRAALARALDDTRKLAVPNGVLSADPPPGHPRYDEHAYIVTSVRNGRLAPAEPA